MIAFAGSEKLMASLDGAISADCAESKVAGVRSALCQHIRNRKLGVPEVCYQTRSEHYARRLLYRSREHGYSVVAMTWGPGQSTPIHDHCGLWCVEGIWAGEIEVVQYELLEVEGDRYRFESRGCMQAGVGSAGSLIPPHEYHTIANASSTDSAISIHVYGGDMKRCNAYVPIGDGWYRRESRELGFD